jgi:hypothetical protein
MEPVLYTGQSTSAGRLLGARPLLPRALRELDALLFKAELEVAQSELEDVSKKAGIAELEWEDQRKQLLATIDDTALELLLNPIWLLILITITLHFAARDAELN